MPKAHLNNHQRLIKTISELNDDFTRPWSDYPCIPWWGSTCDEYGILRVGGTKGKTQRAHRVSYEHTHGTLADPGICVCHHCDNPPCFRPIHLFAGLNVDNVADMIQKGRRFQYDSSGERHGMAKLGEDDIAKMKILHLLTVSNGRIAQLFGVQQSAVSRILTGKRWRDKFGSQEKPRLLPYRWGRELPR